MLLDWYDTDRSHRHTPLIASELARYKIDIAAPSETRLAGKEELTEKSSGYSFFWSGREARVGYAIKTSLVDQLIYPLNGVNDCFMTMRLPLHHGKKVCYHDQH